MSINFHLCTAIFLLGIGSMDGGVTQTPKRLVKEKGQEATLNCQQNLNHDYMYWYRQDDKEGLQLMFYFNNNELFGNFTNNDHFKPNRVNKTHLNLQIGSLESKDTAMYFCSTSD
uniref:Ig-like domain-containing protein n=1 Tax=Sarcophilus harrisii TaxID=9305 RepID=G3VTB0_SARHA